MPLIGQNGQNLENVAGGGAGWNLTGNTGTGLTDVLGTLGSGSNENYLRLISQSNYVGYFFVKNSGSLAIHNIGIGSSVFSSMSTTPSPASTYGNSALGGLALSSLTNGFWNTAVGAAALQGLTLASGNVAIGGRALQSLTTESNNIAIGYNASQSMTGFTNTVAIGSSATATKSNQIVLGDTNITETKTFGTLLSKFGSLATDPTATEIPDGFTAVYKNTTSNVISLWANNGGTLVKIDLS